MMKIGNSTINYIKLNIKQIYCNEQNFVWKRTPHSKKTSVEKNRPRTEKDMRLCNHGHQSRYHSSINCVHMDERMGRFLKYPNQTLIAE